MFNVNCLWSGVDVLTGLKREVPRLKKDPRPKVKIFLRGILIKTPNFYYQKFKPHLILIRP